MQASLHGASESRRKPATRGSAECSIRAEDDQMKASIHMARRNLAFESRLASPHLDAIRCTRRSRAAPRQQEHGEADEMSTRSLWIAVLGATLWWTATPSFAQREFWNTPTEPFQVIDNLYYVGTQGLASYLVVTPEGNILIDGALESSVPLIEASIAKLGFKVSDIKVLLNSHAHFDHSGGLAKLKEKTGASLAAMKGDVSALEGGFYLGSEDTKELGAPPVKVDRKLEDGDTVELGGTVLRAHHTPGHTRGCTSWGMTAQDRGKSHQVLIFCSATVALNRITPPLQYEGIVEDYRRTFAKVKQMKVDVPLAPHPELFALLAKRERAKLDLTLNAFVDPTSFGPFIQATEGAFESTLQERTKALEAKPGS
jgi:metallo-beta-lactamase class B